MSEAINSLERLLRLRDAGALSEEEFQAQKARILSASELTYAEAGAKSGSFIFKHRAGARRWAGTGKGKIVIGASLLLLAAAAAGWWWFSPYWTLRNMQAALAARDADAFSRYVDFPSLRNDLKADMLAESAEEARKAKQQGMGDGLAVLGAAMAGPMIDGIVSPGGLRVIFAMKNPDGRDFGIMSATADGAKIARTGLSEFRVRDAQGGALIFKLKGLGWKLSAVDSAPRKLAARNGKAQPKVDSPFDMGLPMEGLTSDAPMLETAPTPAPTPAARNEQLFGEWKESSVKCDADGGFGYSFASDGDYGTDGQGGSWSTDGNVLVLRHDEGTERVPFQLANNQLTLNFDDGPFTFRRCARRAYGD